MKWKIKYFKEINSTQQYLLEKIKNGDLNYYCIWTEFQTNGIGTKNNKWIGKKGNLFFSFVIDLNEFSFVPLEKLSIYFSFLMYKTLNKYKQNLLIKWPNDIFIFSNKPKKISGVLVNIRRKKIVCGIGVNTKHSVLLNGDYEAGCLELNIKNDKILKEFLNLVSQKPTWEKVFNEYNIIFEKSKKFLK